MNPTYTRVVRADVGREMALAYRTNESLVIGAVPGQNSTLRAYPSDQPGLVVAFDAEAIDRICRSARVPGRDRFPNINSAHSGLKDRQTSRVSARIAPLLEDVKARFIAEWAKAGFDLYFDLVNC